MSKLGTLQNRTTTVTKDTIAQLERKDLVELAEFDVIVSVTVICEDCQQKYTVRNLLNERATVIARDVNWTMVLSSVASRLAAVD